METIHIKKFYLNDEIMSSPFSFYYSKEQIQKMYYEDYYFNLNQVINSAYFKNITIPLKDLLIRPEICVKDWDVNTTNTSLLQWSNERVKLGEDIISKGTYWPYVFISRPPLNQYYIKYGNHRAISLKIIQAQKRIPKTYSLKGFLCDENFLNAFADDDESFNFQIPETMVILNTEIIERAKIKQRFISLKNVKKINDFTIKCSINNVYDLWYAHHSYSLFLRNVLMEYNIPPLKIFNPGENLLC